MMKSAATALFTAAPGAALAHPGHLAEATGHAHWIGLAAALGAAGLAALIWKGRRAGKEENDETDETPEGERDGA